MPYKNFLEQDGAALQNRHASIARYHSPFLTAPPQPGNLTWVSNMGPMMKLWWVMMAVNALLIVGLLFFAG
jgi:hypothetical protein